MTTSSIFHRSAVLLKVRGFSSTRVQHFEAFELLEPVRASLIGLQQCTGLSWPAFIPFATIVLRLALTSPLYMINRIRTRRQAKINPILNAMVPVFRAQLAAVSARTNRGLTPEQITVLATKERRKARIRLYKEYKCQNWKLLALPAVQGPLFIIMSLTIRAMCGWTMIQGFPIEEKFIHEGFLWCESLVKPDEYGVLPLAVGACALANVELNASQYPPKPGPNIHAALLNLSRFGALLFMVFSFQAPSAIGLYWLSSNAFSLLQNGLCEFLLPRQMLPDYPNVSKTIVDPPRKMVKYASQQSDIDTKK